MHQYKATIHGKFKGSKIQLEVLGIKIIEWYKIEDMSMYVQRFCMLYKA
jgi:hypothetical protein